MVKKTLFVFVALTTGTLIGFYTAPAALEKVKQYKEKKPGVSTEIEIKNKNPQESNKTKTNKKVNLVWFTDFKGDRVAAVNREKEIVWEQHMGTPPIPPASYATNTEYVTVADDGNLIVADGDGMMVQEIARKTHELLWQYGVKDKQDYAGGEIHQPDKSFKIGENEILINDGNNRRVIIVNQDTDKVVWQYGTFRKMGWGPNLLRGNTGVRPINNAKQFLITDTLEKKVIIVDRASKKILHRWSFPDAKWIQHAWYTKDGGLVMEDRQKDEVFEVDRNGKRLWTLTRFASGRKLSYPTDVIKLNNKNVLIAEAGRGRIVEVNPKSGEVVWQFKGAGFVTTIDVE